MLEKIKINVTQRTASILVKDTESFEFYKKDGRTINRNALLTRLIVNYHETFRSKEEELFSYLKKALSAARLSKTELEDLCYKVAGHVNKREAAPGNEKFTMTVGVKPTKESEPIIAYIEDYLLGGSTVSEYFRNMFSSYASLPQDEREKIIFLPQYRAIQRAIEKKKTIFVTTRGGKEKKLELSPYCFACSKEELHGYLLAGRKNDCIPLRLSRIVSVTELAEPSVFTQDQIEIFQKMLAYGPQFIYGKNEKEVEIQLTEQGIDKFKKMYVHRPIPVRVENDRYYFACSYMQIVQYFQRFGKDARVIRPQHVRDAIVRFHREAVSRYLCPDRYAVRPKQTFSRTQNKNNGADP